MLSENEKAYQKELDEKAEEAERTAKQARTGAYSSEAEVQREIEAIEKKNAAIEKKKMALVKYRNVEFAGERETLTSIDARLMSEGWESAPRAGSLSLELDTDPEEVLDDELNNDNFRIVVLGNAAYIYRRNVPRTQHLEDKGDPNLLPLAERKRLFKETHFNVELAGEDETEKEIDGRLAKEGYESMHHSVPLKVFRNEDIEGIFSEWFKNPDHYLVVLTKDAALLYKKRPNSADPHRNYDHE